MQKTSRANAKPAGIHQLSLTNSDQDRVHSSKVAANSLLIDNDNYDHDHDCGKLHPFLT